MGEKHIKYRAKHSSCVSSETFFNCPYAVFFANAPSTLHLPDS